MKFVQVLDETFINVDEISHLSYEHTGKVYISSIFLKSGIRFSFLDFPHQFTDIDDQEVIFNCAYANLLHNIALHIILDSKKSIIEWDHLDGKSWEIFLAEHKKIKDELEKIT